MAAKRTKDARLGVRPAQQDETGPGEVAPSPTLQTPMGDPLSGRPHCSIRELPPGMTLGQWLNQAIAAQQAEPTLDSMAEPEAPFSSDDHVASNRETASEPKRYDAVEPTHLAISETIALAVRKVEEAVEQLSVHLVGHSVGPSPVGGMAAGGVVLGSNIAPDGPRYRGQAGLCRSSGASFSGASDAPEAASRMPLTGWDPRWYSGASSIGNEAGIDTETRATATTTVSGFPTERFDPDRIDQFGARETARQFFTRVWGPAVESGQVFSDDIRREDPRFYNALRCVLKRAKLSFRDIGLETSPTRGKIPGVRTEDEALARRREAGRLRKRRQYAAQSGVDPDQEPTAPRRGRPRLPPLTRNPDW